MIEVVEDDVDELTDSGFSKAAVSVYDKIDHGKDGILPSSKSIDFIDTVEEGFHSEELADHLQKLDLN